MTIQFRRKLYHRGGSFETTIPIQMLFDKNLSKKNYVIFELDQKSKRWIISFSERPENSGKRRGK